MDFGTYGVDEFSVKIYNIRLKEKQSYSPETANAQRSNTQINFIFLQYLTRID